MHEFVLAVCCMISGNVHAASGTPLAGAHVSLQGPMPKAFDVDASGAFTLLANPGEYRLTASAAGYTPVTVAVEADHDVTVEIALEPLDSPKLRQIGSVSVDGRLTRILGTVPSTTLTRASYDARGFDRVVDGLQLLPGATFARPDGGAASGITVVALRGPDPSESLLTLDGQLLNDGNTGDLDLSRLSIAAFSAVDVTEGLGPQDSNGSNTFGGAINLITLRPTKDPHEAFSTSLGSFGRTETWFNATGTQGRLGYAVALDDANEAGYVHQTVPLFSNTDSNCSPCATPLGSSIAAHTAMANATWSFSQNADLTGRVFILGDNRDQSSALNGIDHNQAEVGLPQYGRFIGPGNQTFAQSIRAYQLRGRIPLGSGELTTEVSASDNSIGFVGGGTSPYDVVHIDHRYNAALAWQRTFETSQFSIGGYTRYESLAFEAPPSTDGSALSPSQALPTLGQTVNVMYVRGGVQASPKLHFDAGAFESRYTTFGSNLDGRLGAIYAADPRTSVRFSIGTGFRPPLLIERYAFPYSQLPLDANNVFVGQGSTGEHPEHATEYELGISHEFNRSATVDLSLYQTNLRNPIEIYYPLAAVSTGVCAANSPTNVIPACVSFQSNVGNAVYQGLEARYVQRFAPAHLLMTASYGLNVSYPKDLNAQYSNPTSGGNLVNNQQFLGVPQQQGSLQLDWSDRSWHAATTSTVRGKNNELGQGPFTVVNALVGRQIGSHADLSLAGTNLFNGAAGRFTQFGAGAPARGVNGQDASGAPVYGSLPTDALFIEPAAFRLILTLRH